MDSPNASGYVPLSLVDTLSKPSRSYRSIQATPSSSSSSSSSSTTLSSSRSYHHAHTASLAALASKERSEQARREAAAISETLGLLETPLPANRQLRKKEYTSDSEVDSTPKPHQQSQSTEIAVLKKKLGEKDEELGMLRRELAISQKDKKDLLVKCELLEKDIGTGKGSARGGLDAVQVEELVKQFNDQEALLGGYQREAEKSLAELDRLRNKERRLTDWFERMYGPTWADELNLSDKPSLSSSPAFRSKLSSRPSLLPTSSSSSVSTLSSSDPVSTSQDPSSSATSPLDPSASSPVPAVPPPTKPNDPTLTPIALKHHLESVQALIRGMETRLIARGVELEATEKRARGEARVAESKRGELEEFVLASSKEGGEGVRA